ncbi:MAG: colanic acid biosynthesis glycosyltransferase WcaL, partial [Anaerolineae bacterium]|nr:colanic acid biosynthesis glycosyltransferase WcaL [Anaerolineae bacterium]
MNTPIAKQTMPIVAYVVKRYPVYSQTFIVNEILAHEAAGMQTRIFALHPPNDAHFQDSIARVRAPVTYLQASSSSSVKASELWSKLRELGAAASHIWPVLEKFSIEDSPHRGEGVGETYGWPDARKFSIEDSGDVYRAVLLALEVKRRGIQHLHAHFATSASTVTRMAAQFA